MEPQPTCTWREVTDWSGRTYHPTMQFERISVSRGSTQGPPFSRSPRVGNLKELCAALYESLASWTTNTDIWLGIWEGHGILHHPKPASFSDANPDCDRELAELGARIAASPRFEHPNRSYLLARTPITAVTKLSRFAYGITPSLAWPDDFAWCVATEMDFDSTLVAASEECPNALLADDRLETLRVQPEGRLDIGGDALNDDVLNDDCSTTNWCAPGSRKRSASSRGQPDRSYRR